MSLRVAPARQAHGTRRPLLTVAPSGLAGFTGLRRVGPSLRYYAFGIEAHQPSLGVEFDLAIADCEFRAPLTPRLARPHTYGRSPPSRVSNKSAFCIVTPTQTGVDTTGLWIPVCGGLAQLQTLVDIMGIRCHIHCILILLDYYFPSRSMPIQV